MSAKIPAVAANIRGAWMLRRRRNIQAPLMFAATAGIFALMITVAGVGLSIYALVPIPYLSVKLALSIRYRPASGDPRDVGTVGAIVPFYNEDPAGLRACL